ncbi:MAG: AI-2E family transporter [Saprospiraceae bacterium]
MKELKSIRILLTVIVVPVIFYLLKILSFIFIPLFFGLFFSLLFLPLLRWLKKKKIPNLIALIMIVILIVVGILGGISIARIASHEVVNADQVFVDKAAFKVDEGLRIIENWTDMKVENNSLKSIIQNREVFQVLQKNFGTTLSLIQRLIVNILMTLFFLILLLSGSIDFQELMYEALFKNRMTSIKTFLTIERSISKFVQVKFVLSFATGLGFGLACYFFGVSFPLFWGLLTFALNFVQMIGSVISTILLALFAFIEINTTGNLLFFALILTGIQVLFGGVLEPIFMGQSFKINTIMVLVMLMLWGFIWGVPGLILSVPITVVLKTIIDETVETKLLSKLLS